MHAPGFRFTPITARLLTLLLSLSLLVSLTSTKPRFHLQLHPHLYPDFQLARLALFQFPISNSGELLFTTLLLYHLRIVERLYGSRKYLSLLAYTWLASTLVLPALLAAGYAIVGWNYVPPGPTAMVFAGLANYWAIVPATYRMSVVLPAGAGELEVTDRVWVWVVAAQVAAQSVGSLVAAVAGWAIGWLWREEAMVGSAWRVNARILRLLGGERRGEEWEGVRRRLRGTEEEEEGQARRGWVRRVVGIFGAR